MGSILSNGEGSPACREKNDDGNRTLCPCCASCVARIQEVDRALVLLPNRTHIIALNQPGLLGDVDVILDAIADLADIPLALAHRSMDEVHNATQNVMHGLRETENARTALAELAWVPAWIICGLLVLAALLGFAKLKASECCWWTAYVMIVVYLCAIILPLFSLFSVTSIPLTDFCELLPQPNGDPLSFFGALSSAGVATSLDPAPLLQNIIGGCMLASGNRLWDSFGQGPAQLQQRFNSVNVTSKIPESVRNRALSTDAQAQPYAQNSTRIQNLSARDAEFASSADCAGITAWDCTGHYTLYRQDLSQRISALQEAAGNATREIRLLNESTGMVRGNISMMTREVDSQIVAVASVVHTSVGRCTEMSEVYADFRHVLCDEGLAASAVAVWGCLLMLWLGFLPMFVAICQGVKQTFQHREGAPKSSRPVWVQEVEIVLLEMVLDITWVKVEGPQRDGAVLKEEMRDEIVECLQSAHDWVTVEEAIPHR